MVTGTGAARDAAWARLGRMSKHTIGRRDVVAAMAVATGAGALPALAAGAATAGVRPPGLVLPAAGPGRWDATTVSCPRVLRLGPRDYRMWYYGRDPDFDRAIGLPTGRIGLARSSDGRAWERVAGAGYRGSIMDPADDPLRFDSAHLGLGEVQVTSDGFEMWYFGGDTQLRTIRDRTVKGFPLRIGRAVSRDGVAWQRTEGPVRGAVLDAGAEGEPDASGVGWPQVLRLRGDLWRMYYHSISPKLGFVVLAAESTDGGRNWRRLGVVFRGGGADDFDPDGASTRHVFWHEGRFHMLYEGWRGDRIGVGLARSSDGLNWERVRGSDERGAVLAPTASGSGLWDCGAVGTPWFVDTGPERQGQGRYHLYYVARPETKPGDDEISVSHQIGLAVTDNPQLTQWRRWVAEPPAR